MKFTLKRLDGRAIPAALAKAERYRLLNEPEEAESICLDIVATEPDHQEALACLLLALTDQLGRKRTVGEAQALLPRLRDEYQQSYYAGIISERWAKAQLAAGLPGHAIYHWLRDALEHYQRAETLSPAGIEDAVLRWNACVRLLQHNPQVHAKTAPEPDYGDEPPG